MNAKKVYDDVEEKVIPEVVVNEARLKQIVRTIAAVGGQGRDAVQEVDREISTWINNGWKLFYVHFIGSDNQGGWIVLYVLTKD